MTYTTCGTILLVISSLTFIGSLFCTNMTAKQTRKEVQNVMGKLSVHDEKIMALEDKDNGL